VGSVRNDNAATPPRKGPCQLRKPNLISPMKYFFVVSQKAIVTVNDRVRRIKIYEIFRHCCPVMRSSMMDYALEE